MRSGGEKAENRGAWGGRAAGLQGPRREVSRLRIGLSGGRNVTNVEGPCGIGKTRFCPKWFPPSMVGATMSPERRRVSSIATA